jgi:uncharacterized protein YdhG (YjbR/CyaY superfamily)
MKKYKDIPEYIATFPKDMQALLKQMRSTISKAAPKATEAIKYGMPAYIFHGNMVFFGGFKNHVSLFPTPSAIAHFRKELAPYEISKGTIKFSADEKLPLTLISRITKFRVKEQAERKKRGV